MVPKVKVQVFSDFLCPFCYVGKRRLDRLGRDYSLETEWKAFELRPDGVPMPEPDSEYIRNAWVHVNLLAQEEGLSMTRPAHPPRSRMSLEAQQHALAQGKGEAFSEAVFHSLFAEDRNIADVGILADIAEVVGIERQGMLEALSTRRYAGTVESHIQEARAYGINGVPTFLIGRYMVIGAQPLEVLKQVVEKVLEEDGSPF